MANMRIAAHSYNTCCRQLITFLGALLVLAGPRLIAEAVRSHIQLGPSDFEELDRSLNKTCTTSCGGVSIPYPFNLGEEGCPGLPQFLLGCKEDKVSNSSVLTLSSNYTGELQVLSISPESLLVNATHIRASCCNCTMTEVLILDPNRPFTLSGENKFFVNGCNSRGYFSSDKSDGYILKCETGCNNPDPVTDTYCNVFGCCSSPVPAGSREIIFSGGATAHSANSSAGSCGFSSIVYPKSYSTQNVSLLGSGQYGMKLQWAIELEDVSTCEEARSSPEYACATDATCNFDESVPGYNCICDKKGYVGDGYKLGTGCSDVNECEGAELNACDENAICTNTDGGHECKCREPYIGDGLEKGTGCAFPARQIEYTASLAAITNSSRRATTTGACNGTKAGCKTQERKGKKFVALVIGIVSSTALVCVLFAKFVQWVYKSWSCHRHRTADFYTANLTKLKFLAGEPARLFTYKELSKAANGFAADREIGTGGYGTVFKGTLLEGTPVAIKKTNHVSESGAEQFLNEVTILSQVNHRNLVKLLGCCLETEVPMLVYEFIPNGTLYDHLQDEDSKPLKWGQRLQIAIETAEALTYLHSAAFPPIYHRDVKSTNILMDSDLTVKVTDFGLSRLVPKDVTHVSTVVMGTPGYMDPEYYHNYQLTDRSDVYSFGVVLMELITSKKPVDFTRSSSEVNLAALSLMAIRSDRLIEIVDPIFKMFPPQTSVLEAIQSVATLAVACLAPSREQRPSMREVVDHLVRIKEDYDRCTEEEETSIKHKEYSDPAGIIGVDDPGAFFWDALDTEGMVDEPMHLDLLDLQAR